MENDATIASLEQQLTDFYAGRERLDQELGVSDPDDIIALVHELRHRLSSCSVERDETAYSLCELAVAALYNHLHRQPRPANGGHASMPALAAPAAATAAGQSAPAPSPNVAAKEAAPPAPAADQIPSQQQSPAATPAAESQPAKPVADIDEDRSQHFASDEVLARLPDMDQQERDEQDFGIVEVDDSGKVVSYNRYESELSGVDQSSTHGKNFFTQIAPCTNNRLFYGRFKRGVQAAEMDAQIPYTFTYKMRPTNVLVRLFRHPDTSANFVLVQKR